MINEVIGEMWETVAPTWHTLLMPVTPDSSPADPRAAGSNTPSSKFPDVVARMAVDADFARYAQSEPDAVAEQYGLSDEEKEKMLALTDAGTHGGPSALDQRLSKSGFGAGLSGIVGSTFGKPDTDDPHSSRWVGPGTRPESTTRP